MMAMLALMMAAIFSLVGLMILLPFLVLWFWILARICRKAGYSGWWSLTTLFPPLMIVMVWIMAFSEWPLGAPRIEIIPPRHRF
jgi:hypothetical protein